MAWTIAKKIPVSTAGGGLPGLAQAQAGGMATGYYGSGGQRATGGGGVGGLGSTYRDPYFGMLPPSPFGSVTNDSFAARGVRGMIGGYGGGGGYNINQRRQEALQRRALQQGVSGLQGLVGQYNQAFQSARAANEARYQQLLDIANQTTGQREADIRADYARQQASQLQGLARVGLANTTIAPTLGMGIQREQQSALNRLADAMQQTRLGIIERREDRYPEMGAITSLASMLGQGGGVQGLGGVLSALSGLRM